VWTVVLNIYRHDNVDQAFSAPTLPLQQRSSCEACESLGCSVAWLIGCAKSYLSTCLVRMRLCAWLAPAKSAGDERAEVLSMGPGGADDVCGPLGHCDAGWWARRPLGAD
jgi:hypothetical protein